MRGGGGGDVVVEDCICGPWVYSARESNLSIMDELRMDIPGIVDC